MPYYQFPGSDFHDLNLDWLLQQMKNCLAEWATTKTQWESVSAEWEALKQFVTDYFDNLDVSQEISDKINAMAADGSLLAVIQETVGTSAADEAGAWLTEHIAAISGYVIDNSLTVTNAAADAKEAGIRTGRNSAAFNDEFRVSLASSSKVRTVNATTGAYQESTKTVATDHIIMKTHHYIEAAQGYTIGTFVFVNGEPDASQNSGWVQRLTIAPNVEFVFLIRKSDNTEITLDEAVKAVSSRPGGQIRAWATEGMKLSDFLEPAFYNLYPMALAVFSDTPPAFVDWYANLEVYTIAAGTGTNNKYVFQDLSAHHGNYTMRRVLRVAEGTGVVYIDWYWVNTDCAIAGKTFSIMGDSVSTYRDKIPSGYATYYPHSGNNVNDWTETYWGMLVTKAGMKLLINNSWSGSYVSYNGSNEASYMAGPARIDALGDTAPDYMVILAGGNDCNNTVPIGEVTPDPVNLASVTAADASTYAQAYKIMLTRIKTKFPNTKLIILWYHNMSASPNNAHGGTNYATQAEYAAVTRYYADLFGAQFIDLRKCGIDQFNNTGLETANHPNEEGMKMYYSYITQMVVR